MRRCLALERASCRRDAPDQKVSGKHAQRNGDEYGCERVEDGAKTPAGAQGLAAINQPVCAVSEQDESDPDGDQWQQDSGNKEQIPATLASFCVTILFFAESHVMRQGFDSGDALLENIPENVRSMDCFVAAAASLLGMAFTPAQCLRTMCSPFPRAMQSSKLTRFGRSLNSPQRRLLVGLLFLEPRVRHVVCRFFRLGCWL